MKTALIIEDNLEIRENLTEILELAGYTIVTASNGNEGLKMVTGDLPDFILCDIMMPEMDGYNVIREIKANPKTKEIPFIYVTASAEKSEMKKALDMGADGYVRKPFDIEELMDAINKALKR